MKAEMPKMISENTPEGFDSELIHFMECIVIELDHLGNIVRMNPFTEEYFGRNNEELSGQPFVGALFPKQSSTGENQLAVFDNFMRCPGENGSFDVELQVSDGSLKRITCTTITYFDADGAIEKIICMGINRRVCKRRERDFQRKYDLLESFLEASEVNAVAMNSERSFFYISPCIENVIGYPPDEIVGRTPGDFLEPEEEVQVTGLMEEKIREETSEIHLVSQVEHKNGTPVWCEMDGTLSYHENGKFDCLYGLCRNIEEQKRAESSLLEKEKEFRFCIEHAQVLLTVTNEKGVIKTINRAGAKLYGKEPDEMIGHVFTEFLPDFERERVFQTFKRDFRTAMAKTDNRTVGMGGLINKIRTPDGLKDILFYKTGVKIYKDGEFEGILNTAVDITEVVKAREELKRHRNHLEQLVVERTAELEGLQEEIVHRERLTALGKMANVISHEIRTPLSTINNSLFVIYERLKEKEIGVKRSLDRANRAIQRCYSIVDEFKIFTQTEELRKNVTQIDTWLGDILDQLTGKPGTSVKRELDSGVTMEIDRDRIKRAVINVIENARQAGKIRNKGQIVVKSRLAFNRLEISVEDEGVGIELKDLENVFEPLFSKKSFGMGLGLPISRQVMEQHGGGISIESEEKKGTKVLLWLPVDQTAL